MPPHGFGSGENFPSLRNEEIQEAAMKEDLPRVKEIIVDLLSTAAVKERG